MDPEDGSRGNHDQQQDQELDRRDHVPTGRR
jgi:hypothetical protein